jgi:preprotein translocase subunit SecD
MGATRPENKIDTKRRRKLVLRLRKEGLLYREIAGRIREQFSADELPNGYDAAYVGKDLRRALQNVESDLETEAQDMLRMELRRLNELQAAMWSKAMQGEESAVDRILNVMQRRAKYLGLDEPDEIRAEIGGGLDVSVLLDALEEYPEARQAAAEALSASDD